MMSHTFDICTFKLKSSHTTNSNMKLIKITLVTDNINVPETDQ